MHEIDIDARRRPQRRAGTAVLTPTITRWPLAARAASWTLLAMTLTALWVFAPG